MFVLLPTVIGLIKRHSSYDQRLHKLLLHSDFVSCNSGNLETNWVEPDGAARNWRSLLGYLTNICNFYGALQKEAK